MTNPVVLIEQEGFDFILEDTDDDSLICRVEKTDKCITLYGRANDDYSRWAPIMHEMVKSAKPQSTAHYSDEERMLFHPNGSPKKRGYKYFHHVHIVDADIEENISGYQKVNGS